MRCVLCKKARVVMRCVLCKKARVFNEMRVEMQTFYATKRFKMQ